MQTNMGTTRFQLQSRATKAASYSLAAADFDLSKATQLIVVLRVLSAERDSANETYDFYVTNGPTASEQWDIAHFPQVATTGAKTYAARINGLLRPENITTAAPGVAAVETGTLNITAAGSGNGAKTLGAGLVRHGPFADFMGLELVIAGTVVTGIEFEIEVFAS
mgnify:CR=1 FL=1